MLLTAVGLSAVSLTVYPDREPVAVPHHLEITIESTREVNYVMVRFESDPDSKDRRLIRVYTAAPGDEGVWDGMRVFIGDGDRSENDAVTGCIPADACEVPEAGGAYFITEWNHGDDTSGIVSVPLVVGGWGPTAPPDPSMDPPPRDVWQEFHVTTDVDPVGWDENGADVEVVVPRVTIRGAVAKNVTVGTFFAVPDAES